MTYESLILRARVREAAERDAGVRLTAWQTERASNLAGDLWRSAQLLAASPEAALAQRHVMQSVIEARDALNRIIEGNAA